MTILEKHLGVWALLLAVHIIVFILFWMRMRMDAERRRATDADTMENVLPLTRAAASNQ